MTKGTRQGTITVEGQKATISFERWLPYPIAAVWAAITDPVERAAWFGETTIDGCVGGTIEMVADGPPATVDMRRMSGRILVWDPPHVLEHEWKQSIIGDTVTRYELREEEGGTLLRFTHRGMRAPEARGYIPGEHAYLDRLEARLGGQPLPSWMARYGEVQSLYGKWQGPSDAGPNEGTAR